MIEVLIALPILAMVASMFSSTVISMYKQRAINRQNARATNGMQTQLERMRNEPLESVFALYNDDPLDDPDGPGTAPGAFFDVAGLQRLQATPDVPVGEVLLPVVNTAPPGDPPVWELREDLDDRDLGMPRDLNRDFVIDDQNHAVDYTALPTIVRIRWQGPLGPRTAEMYTLLIEYRTGT